jgi:dTDP-4-amino-4,6-dideoxygalactose transaminase
VSIPLFATSLAPERDALLQAIERVVDSGRYILGPEVEAFEAEFAEHLDVRHCIGVANGTDALAIALRAIGVGAGDEVVVPSFTFYATAEAVAAIGAVPVFCDIDAGTFCVTGATVEPVLTERTRAVVPVHLFGNVAPVEELTALGVPVVEDAAQAAGARLTGRPAGSLGTAATFSFFPSKNLGCLGDGGAITTNDDEVAALARRLRFHGSEDKATFTEVGYNSRLDALQAAALRVLLPRLDGWNEARRAAAAAYAERGLAGLPGVSMPEPVDGAEVVHHLFVIRHERADELAAALAERGIQARGYYRTPVHRQPAMAPWGGDAALPVTDEVARTHLALPMGPELTAAQAGEVVDALRSAIG